MRRLELPDQWEERPELRRHIGELMLAGRRRTALDEFFGCCGTEVCPVWCW